MAAETSQTNSRKSNRRASCETLCSSNSSCVLQKRKPLHPLASSVRSTKTSNNPVTQRILSAKILRFKTLQNQLNDAHYHITQLANENKLLKDIQRRQDQALTKYEGANAQIPQVMVSHQEEIRVLQVKNKNLRKTVKDLSDQLKNKNEEIVALKDQNKYLLTLCKNKSLEERKELQDKVDDLNEKIKQNESTISLLNRKLMLESKNGKFKLNSEVNKHKQTQKELQKALCQLDECSYKDEKSSDISRKLPKKDINPKQNTSDLESSSTSSLKSQEIHPISPDPDLKSSSEIQLKEIVNNWHKKTNKMDENVKKFSEQITESNRITDKHEAHFKKSIENTELILQALKETDIKNEKLSKLNATGDKMSFYDYAIFSQKNASDLLMSQLLKEKQLNCGFEEDLLSEQTSKNLTISEEVDDEDKKNLLAKLKAIDNGDNIVVGDLKKAKCDLMKELFGA